MKKITLFVLLFVSIQGLKAQNISILGYGGALTGSYIYPLASDVRLKGNYCYGAGVEFEMPEGSLTLAWTGQQTSLSSRAFMSSDVKLLNVNVNYFQVGFNKDLTEGDVRPHSIFSMGLAQFSPNGTYSFNEKWFFAASFGIGLKANITDKVALRLQAKGTMPLEMGGMGIFCGFGSGCSPDIYFNPILVQGEFTAGVSVQLN